MTEPRDASKRLFIALELPEAVRAAIAQACRALPKELRVKWVAPQKLHLTLAFLGATAPGELPRLEGVLSTCAAAATPFTLSVGRAGTFGAPLHPRVLWLGVEGALEPARALQASLEAALALPKEHDAWTPHLTLARARARGGDVELARAAAAFPALSLPPFELSEATLFESAGGHYVPLTRAPLGSR